MSVPKEDALDLLYAIMEYVESSQWRCSGENEHLRREQVLYDRFRRVTGYRPVERYIDYKSSASRREVGGRWWWLSK
jgi:hypothetical protein